MKLRTLSFMLLVSLVVSIASAQSGQDDLRGSSPREVQAKLYLSYVEARNQNNFTEAKAILDRMIQMQPGDSGNYLQGSRLCYETQDFVEAAKYFKLFQENFSAKGQPTGLLASNFVMETLIQAAKNHRQPDWRSFSAKFGPEVPLVETLRKACRSAIVENRTRTAATLLDELQRLGVPAGELSGMRGSLKKRIDSRIGSAKR